MMRINIFAKRTAKEILRDPLNIIFGIGFPLVVLLMLSAIQANIPVPLFEIERLAPGISVFGLSFMTLFSATLVARDRETSFMERLYTTPLRASEFILGYFLPMIPIALMQCVVSYLVALIIGLAPSVNIFAALLASIPTAAFYISLGLLAGTLLNVKQVGGICGALLTNVSAWLSGIWFDLDLVGGAFATVAECLPFYHAVELARKSLGGYFTAALPHLALVTVYAAVITIIAIAVFFRQMKRR